MQKEISPEQAFMRHLRRRSEPADLARMRRALGDPGAEVIPVVEGFLARIQGDDPRSGQSPGGPIHQGECEDRWERLVYYLVAGLWATTVSSSELEHFRQQPEEEPAQAEENTAEAGYRRTLGHAVAELYLARNQSQSIEQRFIALLDADEEQLPYRIRQMVQLLKGGEGISIYWPELLRDLLAWKREHRPVQQKWARAFYRTVSKEGGQE
ncbi:type I-E CRISPR-associated protein Cse2/CasB [Meiothermus rufus]|uniref:type I-E CRISPR-associated protein Cse2/CasB n=1 Tax=Meiothermus rufus TaxID=604332 RepID=UPI0004022612|nr:type I-E CRISPR-associated protein Cse2/CasB [Meiothermus rufus]